MRFGLHRGCLTNIYLRRGVILLFASLTILDIATPEMCPEKFGGRPLVTAGAKMSEAWAAGNAALSVSGGGGTPHQSPAPLPADDDCICCCAHYLPGVVFHVAHLKVESPIDEAAIVSLPSSPPRSLFHPPRSA